MLPVRLETHPGDAATARPPMSAAAGGPVEAPAKTLTVAVVAPSLDILGGQAVQAQSLMEALRKTGIRVRFIPINPRFPRRLRWVRRVPVLRTLLNQCLYFLWLRNLRDVDAVHVFSASYWSFLLAPVPAIIAARLFAKPVILNYHSGEARDHLERFGIGVHPWLRRVDEIVVPSAYLQSVFAEHGYRARVVRNIIETSRFPYRERRPLRPVLLSNRNLEAHYGVDVTLRAFAILKRQWPDARLKVAGYGSESGRLQEWVRSESLRGVEFLGRIEPEAMPGLYAGADIFVNASLVDNQPVSILEAFAAGLPVVTTPVGDIPSMVEDEETGTLVPPKDPAALAAALDGLLESPERAARMARRARREVEKFTWPEVGAAWTDLYRDVANPNDQRRNSA